MWNNNIYYPSRFREDRMQIMDLFNLSTIYQSSKIFYIEKPVEDT